MIFQYDTIKLFLEKKFSYNVEKIYMINGDKFNEKTEINSDFSISYYANSENHPSYSKYNVRQMLMRQDVSYTEILKFSRTRKLENLD